MLRVRLLGALEVELDGRVIESPPSQRPWAVFAYVALSPHQVSRGELASRFWPDVLDQSARASLRSAVWALSRGELLEGIEDEWALSARERHRERVVGLLELLAQEREQRGERLEALDLTRRQVERCPFDEQAHRRLIVRLGALGDRAGGLRAYRLLAERLRRELGVAPSAQTREQVDRLRAGAPAPAGAPTMITPSAMLLLVGRDRKLAELERVWRTVPPTRRHSASIASARSSKPRSGDSRRSQQHTAPTGSPRSDHDQQGGHQRCSADGGAMLGAPGAGPVETVRLAGAADGGRRSRPTASGGGCRRRGGHWTAAPANDGDEPGAVVRLLKKIRHGNYRSKDHPGSVMIWISGCW